MRLETILAAIDQQMAEVAKDALRAPGKELFDYGRSVGLYAGLEQAKTIIIDLVKETDARDRDL